MADVTGETAYYAYLLRLARHGRGRMAVWRITLESAQTRKQVVFASLDDLISFLERQIGEEETGAQAECPENNVE
jgi:hypothetical protein